MLLVCRPNLTFDGVQQFYWIVEDARFDDLGDISCVSNIGKRVSFYNYQIA